MLCFGGWKKSIVYAVKWEWSLARKLKRIGSSNREVDISDAVAMLYEINRRKGASLDWQVAKGWDTVDIIPSKTTPWMKWQDDTK